MSIIHAITQRPWQARPHPTNLPPNMSVWVVRFTGEIFESYDEYLAAIEQYQAKQWLTSSFKTKDPITLEECLILERDHRKRSPPFPESHRRAVLAYVQFKFGSTHDLATELMAIFREEYLPDELVQFKESSNKRFQARSKYLRVIKRIDPTSNMYSLKILDTNEIVNLPASAIYRRQLPFTRDQLKEFIKDNCDRPNLISRLFVKEDVAKSLGIRTVLKDEEKASDARKRRFDYDDDDVERRKKEKRYPCEDSFLTDDERQGEGPRVAPSTDFLVPMDCVGDTLVVWEFCNSFSEILRLSRFDFPLLCTAIMDVSSPKLCDLLQHVLYALLRMIDHPRLYKIDEKVDREKSEETDARNDDEIALMEEANTRIRALLKNKLALNAIEPFLKARINLDPDSLPPEVEAYILSEHAAFACLSGPSKIFVLKRLLDDAVASSKFRTSLDHAMEHISSLYSLKLERCSQYRQQISLLTGTVVDSREEGSDGEGSDQENEEAPSSKSTLTPVEFAKLGVADKAVYLKPLKMEHERQMNKLNKEIKAGQVLRTTPLGMDREGSRYWLFNAESSILFIESADRSWWGKLTTIAEVDQLLAWLNDKGMREHELKTVIQRKHSAIAHQIKKNEVELIRVTGERCSTRLQVKQAPADETAAYINKLYKP